MRNFTRFYKDVFCLLPLKKIKPIENQPIAFTRRNNRIWLFIAIGLSFNIGLTYSQPLLPAFSYDCIGSGENGTELCITNLTTGGTPPLSFEFDFGDGYTTTEENPCHTYASESGTFILTLTVTDATGLSASATVTIDLQDIDCCRLTYTCPPENSGFLTCIEDLPPPDEDLLNVTDYCGILTIDVTDDTSGEGCPGDTLFITRTYILEDDFSQETCVQVFILVDAEAPTITCPDDITVGCAAEVPIAEIDSIVATDLCDSPVSISVEDDIVRFECANYYILFRLFTATDLCGNSATCIQTITVLDTVPPVITCLPDLTVSCGTEVPLPDIDLIVATDLCDGLVTVSVAADDTTGFVCETSYSILRVYTATDACGNTASCTQTITVSDTITPVIICLPDITVACAEDVPLPAPDSIVTTDLCGTLISVTVADDDTTDFICSNQYTLLRIYTAVDSCGNSASCTQAITVLDTVAPVITCLANINVGCSDIPLPDLEGIVAIDLCDSLVNVSVAVDDTTDFNVPIATLC
jgi:PKD repeat protein